MQPWKETWEHESAMCSPLLLLGGDPPSPCPQEDKAQDPLNPATVSLQDQPRQVLRTKAERTTKEEEEDMHMVCACVDSKSLADIFLLSMRRIRQRDPGPSSSWNDGHVGLES